MADLAAQAGRAGFMISGYQVSTANGTDMCGDSVAMVIDSTPDPLGLVPTQVITWVYATPSVNTAGILAGEVHSEPYSDYTSNGNIPDCPSPSTDPTWT